MQTLFFRQIAVRLSACELYYAILSDRAMHFVCSSVCEL